eukprot:TRINITY_DN3402_c0_g1_i1.p1 TRINITY_DN3402_c0_g1~~TRINITY_DN3402_c0_g1_i1.p1  ORF type:complete len:288 (+),score=66.57 TRINITY_DN3402_c0_g1_i1:498-1361(+)
MRKEISIAEVSCSLQHRTMSTISNFLKSKDTHPSIMKLVKVIAHLSNVSHDKSIGRIVKIRCDVPSILTDILKTSPDSIPRFIGSGFPRLYITQPLPKSPTLVTMKGADKGLDTPISFPWGVAVHPVSGDVFMCDNDRNLVMIFDANLKFLRDLKWKSKAGGDGPRSPWGLAFSHDGSRLAVVEYGGSRAQLLDESLNHLCEIGQGSMNQKNFSSPFNAAFDSESNLYVTDSNNNRVMKYDRDGAFLLQIQVSNEDGNSLQAPCGITVTDDDTIVVAEYRGTKIHFF